MTRVASTLASTRDFFLPPSFPHPHFPLQPRVPRFTPPVLFPLEAPCSLIRVSASACGPVCPCGMGAVGMWNKGLTVGYVSPDPWHPSLLSPSPLVWLHYSLHLPASASSSPPIRCHLCTRPWLPRTCYHRHTLTLPHGPMLLLL